MSLRARLTAGTALLLALAVGTGFFAAYRIVRGQLGGELDGALRERAAALAAFGRRVPPTRLERLSRRVRPQRLGDSGGYVQFVRSSGAVVLPAGERTRLPTAGARAVAAGTAVAFFRDATVAGTRERVLTAPLAGGIAVQIARPLTEIDHVLGRLRLLFAVVSLLAIAGAATVGLLLARAALRPVRRLTEHAERIAATGDLHERTDETRSDELGRLAVSFNTMLDALAASVAAQRQLVADASHELRTPLATARTNLEVLELHEEVPDVERRRILAEATEELREMTRLIDELVELARGDAQPLETQPTRLDLVVAEAVTVAARRSGHEFRTALSPSTVEGSPAALARAVSNLLDNAAKWSPPGRPVDVAVESGAVVVQDHGAGIAAQDLPRIFDRFYRAADARTLPGSGLGLAIVRQIAEAHGGTVTVESRHGGGSRFVLRVPVVAPAR